METISTLIDEIFDIKVKDIKKLDGDINYSNLKYALKDHNGKRFVLKIYPDHDELLLAQEESRIFNEIGKSLSFKVPHTIATPNGSLFFDHELGRAKLQDYIEADLMSDVTKTPEMLTSLGEVTGEFMLKMSQIHSPIYASRKLFWDAQNAVKSFYKVKYITDPAKRKLAIYFFDKFRTQILPIQHELRHTMIHGDLNDRNILIKDGKVEGVLDLGDSCFTPCMYEIATAMGYAMMSMENPFEEFSPLLTAYHKVSPLQRREVELMAAAITTKLCISVCNSSEKRFLKEGSEYDLVSEKPAWALLEKWIATNPAFITNQFLKATGFATEDTKSKRDLLLETRKQVAGNSLGLSYKEPIYMKSSAFQYMFDAEGNRYLDICNNIPHVGHCHPLISQAISAQASELNTNTRYLYDGFTDYAEKLLSYFPPQLNKIFMVNSGSAATDLALRMSRTHTDRNKVAILEYGYHGNSTLGIEVSSYKFDGKGGSGAGSTVIKLPFPSEFGGAFDSSDQYVQDAIARIKSSMEEGEKPCAFIGEMISGCGGQIPLAPGYMKALNQFLQENGILTIADEVQTGFGRLGSWFWAYEMHDFIPDIVILGKPMANGHPMGAVVTTSEIAARFSNGMEFFSSFGGNPVSCVVASTVLDIIEEEKLQENAKVVGSAFKQKLIELQTKHECIVDVRGEGLFLGIEFQTSAGEPDSKTTSIVKDKLKEQFILIGTDGPFVNVVKLKPPMCFDLNNVDEFIEKLDNILSAI